MLREGVAQTGVHEETSRDDEPFNEGDDECYGGN